MTRIVIHTPYPVAINAIWRSNRGRVHRSPAYMAWIKQAGLEWLFQRKNQPAGILGPFSAMLVLVKPKGRHDLDGTMKAMLDFCTAHKIIADDSHCQKLYLRWGSPKEAPLGARLILKSI